MSKGVLGNDPFKRGAADRSSDAEAKDEAKPVAPEKPALTDPRTEEVKKRVKGRKPGAPFLESPDKEPQKTRIQTKQKSAKPPLRPPSKIERKNDPLAAVAAERKRAQDREPEVTSPTARKLTEKQPAGKSAKSAQPERASTSAQPRAKAPSESGDTSAHPRTDTTPAADTSATATTKTSAEAPPAAATSTTVSSSSSESATARAPESKAAPATTTAPNAGETTRTTEAFDLKTGERRPIREALRTMTVDSTGGERASARDQVFDVSAKSEPSSLQRVATDVLGRAVMTAAGLVRAVKAGIGAAGAVELDAYGKDKELGSALSPVTDFLYERYWRVTVNGAERIPKGPCILVANHSGALPYDGPVLHAALAKERPDLEDSRWLIEDQIFYAPVVGTLLNRLGAVRANPENAVRLLEENRPLIVFPEGIHGLQKPFAERYQLKRFGRGGFVKIALQTGAPIVPVAIVGAEETSPLLARIPTTLFGMPYLPLTPLGPLPLPAKWHIRIGAPFTIEDLRAAGDEEAVRVQRGTELTREAIQGMLEAVLRDRESAFR